MINEKKNINSKVTLLLTGDIMLGGEFLNFKTNQNIEYEYSFKNIKKIFEDTDIVFGNLECPLSKDGIIRQDKASILYAPPDSINALKYLDYNAISIGNNHINDYGNEGLIKTIEVLNKEGFPYFGAGRNLEEANKEVIIEKNGLRFSFLGYTTNERHVKSIIASSKKAGCVLYSIEKINEDIKRVKSKSDIICISLHWGYEFYRYPSPEQINLAHRIIDAGAHMVIGHHPHVIQGFERYKHGVIFYSLGNFFFPNFYDKSGLLHRWSEESNRSIIAKCFVIEGEIEKIEILTCFMNNNYQLTLLKGKNKEKATFELEEISKNLKKMDYKGFWSAYDKKLRKIMKEKEIEIGFPQLLQKIHDLGINGCINKISIGNIKEAIRKSVGYLKLRLKREL